MIGIVAGLCGIGGILVIPFLVYIVGIDIHVVIPACLAGFCMSAIAANYAYASRGSIRWKKAVFIMAGAAPGAYLGSITVLALTSLALELIVCALVIIVGFRTIRKNPVLRKQDGLDRVSNPVLVLLGAVVGYGSSVTGTAGPLLLVPSLLLLHFPVLPAVGLSMAVQLAITPFSTLGHLIHGYIDWVLAAQIGVGMASGVLVGAAIAHRISTILLERIVGLVLLGSGVMVVLHYVV